MLWICDESCWWHRCVLATAEQCLHSAKALPAPHTAPSVGSPGVHKKLGGDTARTAGPSWPQGCPTPYDVVLSNKSWGKEEKGGGIQLWCLPSQVTIAHDQALLSWKRLNTCLPMGGSEWIPSFALLTHAAFALPVKLSLFLPTSFCIFTLPILSSIPLWGSKRVAAWCWAACRG